MAEWRWGLDGWPKVTIPAVVGGVLLVLIGIAAALFGYAKWDSVFMILTIVFSAVSAAFWFVAALLPIPRVVRNQPNRNHNSELVFVLQRLRRQSQWNAMAASSMFIAVVFLVFQQFVAFSSAPA
jgi:hypothetical protein